MFDEDHVTTSREAFHEALRSVRGYRDRLLDKVADELISAEFARAEQHLGPRHPTSLFLGGLLASLRVQRNDLAGAEELTADILQRCKDHFGTNDSQTLAVQKQLADIRAWHGDHRAMIHAFRRHIGTP